MDFNAKEEIIKLLEQIEDPSILLYIYHTLAAIVEED